MVFGLFHGLVLLPVLLSLVGPKTEIESDVEDEVASNFFFVFLLLANVVSSFFVPPAIKAASNLFSIFFSQLTKVASTSESDSSTVSEVSSVEEGTHGQENQAYQV